MCDNNTASDRKKVRVFVVHGKDTDTRNIVSTFVSNLGLCPVVLESQPYGAKTTIDKFLQLAETAQFAVAILTPDDEYQEDGERRFRARQNVLFELGYFYGKLKRGNVRILKREIALPSDLYGEGYVDLEKSDWKEKLFGELVGPLREHIRTYSMAKKASLENILDWYCDEGVGRREEEAGCAIVRVEKTMKPGGTPSNGSISLKLDPVKKGSVVHVEVLFRCGGGREAMIGLRDLHQKQPWIGDGGWKRGDLNVDVQTDSEFVIDLYAGGYHGRVGDFVYYKDLKVELFSPQDIGAARCAPGTFE